MVLALEKRVVLLTLNLWNALYIYFIYLLFWGGWEEDLTHLTCAELLGVCVAGPGSTTDQSDDEAFTPTEQQVKLPSPGSHPPSHLYSDRLTL